MSGRQATQARPGQTTRETMEELFRLLVECLHAYMQQDPSTYSTRMLNVVRAFLKDAGITAEQGRRLGDAGVLSSMLDLQVPFGGPNGEGH